MSKNLRFCLVVFTNVLFTTVAVLAQAKDPCNPQANTPSNCRESKAAAAEQAGRLREAFDHYVFALRTRAYPARPKDWRNYSPDSALAKEWRAQDERDQRLIAKVIELSQKLDPRPAIPEEAERRMARGQAAMKVAQNAADLETAASEFLEAVNQSPWWADAYFNLGLVREKQGDYHDAIAGFKNYLAAKPTASDTKEVKTKIYELEFLHEKTVKDAANAKERQRQEEAQAAAKRNWVQNLNGNWADESWTDRRFASVPIPGSLRSVSVRGNEIEIRLIGNPTFNRSGTQAWREPKNLVIFKGTIEGNTVKGIYYMYNALSEQLLDSWKHEGAITLGEDGNTLFLHSFPGDKKWIRER